MEHENEQTEYKVEGNLHKVKEGEESWFKVQCLLSCHQTLRQIIVEKKLCKSKTCLIKSYLE